MTCDDGRLMKLAQDRAQWLALILAASTMLSSSVWFVTHRARRSQSLELAMKSKICSAVSQIHAECITTLITCGIKMLVD
jgi:hypothetical protein